MAIAATAVHILPGKTPEFIEFAEAATGPQFVDHEGSRMRLGITVERMWIETTNSGDVLLIYLEGEDLDKSMRMLASSDDSYDLWYKQRFLELTGIDLTDPGALELGEMVFESPEMKIEDPVKATATLMPVLEGRSSFLLLFLDELSGLHDEEYRAYMYRYGISRERFFLLRRPADTMLVMYAEGRDPAEAIADFARSHHPFDIWMREQMLFLNGIDYVRRASAPRADLVLDWKAAPEHLAA